MKDFIEKGIESLQGRWSSWRESSTRTEILKGPWPGWRRSYLLLALAFLLLALAPWIWRSSPPSAVSPASIQSEGRVGEVLLPGSTLFLDPADPSLSAREVIGQKILLRGLRPPRLDFSRTPHQGQLARFQDDVWDSEEINRLAEAELRLRGLPRERLDRQMQELVLQREIESAWLRREADLQGIRIPEVSSLIRQEDIGALREAGLGLQEAENRLLALLLATEIRNIEETRRGNLRALEAEWFQRWAPETDCFVRLPICPES